MSLKTMLGILQVAVQKKIKDQNTLIALGKGSRSSSMSHYHKGYEQALREVLTLLEETEKAVQEEIPG